MSGVVSKEVVYEFMSGNPGRRFNIPELATKYKVARDSMRKRLVALIEDKKVVRTGVGQRVFFHVDGVRPSVAQYRGPAPFRPLSTTYQLEMSRQMAVIRERALR